MNVCSKQICVYQYCSLFKNRWNREFCFAYSFQQMIIGFVTPSTHIFLAQMISHWMVNLVQDHCYDFYVYLPFQIMSIHYFLCNRPTVRIAPAGHPRRRAGNNHLHNDNWPISLTMFPLLMKLSKYFLLWRPIWLRQVLKMFLVQPKYGLISFSYVQWLTILITIFLWITCVRIFI